jgi:hypothetical protein
VPFFVYLSFCSNFLAFRGHRSYPPVSGLTSARLPCIFPYKIFLDIPTLQMCPAVLSLIRVTTCVCI